VTNLVARDTNLMQKLGNYAVLSTEQVQALFFPKIRLLWSLFSDVGHNPNDAILHYEGNTFPLGKIFQVRTLAHYPAHPVSKPD
jgi:hypothetical protein